MRGLGNSSPSLLYTLDVYFSTLWIRLMFKVLKRAHGGNRKGAPFLFDPNSPF